MKPKRKKRKLGPAGDHVIQKRGCGTLGLSYKASSRLCKAKLLSELLYPTYLLYQSTWDSHSAQYSKEDSYFSWKHGGSENQLGNSGNHEGIFPTAYDLSKFILKSNPSSIFSSGWRKQAHARGFRHGELQFSNSSQEQGSTVSEKKPDTNHAKIPQVFHQSVDQATKCDNLRYESFHIL